MAELPQKVSTRIKQAKTLYKVKSHFQRNKKYYLAGASGLAIGAIGALTYSGRNGVHIRVQGDGNSVVFASQQRAAELLGVSPYHLSRDLEDDVGLEVEELGEKAEQ